MDILETGDSFPEKEWKANLDHHHKDELFHIINKTQASVTHEILKKLITNCLSPDQDFWKYIEENNIDLRDENFIVAVQQWASSIHTLPEQKLLFKIAEAFSPCCHAQCWSVFCPSTVLRESLRIQNLTFEDKLSLLHTAIQSRSVSRSRRIKILDTLLHRLLGESDTNNLQKVYDILQNTKGRDIQNIKFGKTARRNNDRDTFLTAHRKNFKDKIKGLQ